MRTPCRCVYRAIRTLTGVRRKSSKVTSKIPHGASDIMCRGDDPCSFGRSRSLDFAVLDAITHFIARKVVRR